MEKLLLHLRVGFIIIFASVFQTVSGERFSFPFSFINHHGLLCGPIEPQLLACSSVVLLSTTTSLQLCGPAEPQPPCSSGPMCHLSHRFIKTPKAKTFFQRDKPIHCWCIWTSELVTSVKSFSPPHPHFF